MKTLWVFLALCFVISCNSAEKKQLAAKDEQARQLAEKQKQDSLAHIQRVLEIKKDMQRHDSAVRKGIDYWYAMQKKEGKYVMPKKEERYTLPIKEEKNEDSYQTGSQIGRCIIKSNAYATTSKASFDMLWNCLANGDKEAIISMIFNGQVTILHQNDVVYLVDTKLWGGL